MIRTVRDTVPEAVVVIGGPSGTFSPEETLELTRADVCVRGAGEGTIVELVAGIVGTERGRCHLVELLGDVPNLVIRGEDGFSHTRAGNLSSFPGDRFSCLDDIPSPYQAGQIATADVGLLTARGCNQHCTYCSFATISGRRVHFHSVERVLEDVAALRALFVGARHRLPSVRVNDDAFTLAPERARAICEGIIRRGLEMPLEAMTRADRVDLDLLRLMKRAGFHRVSFGLESAVPRVLRTVGKVQAPATRADPGYEAEEAYLETFRTAVRLSREAGLTPGVSVIGGLPGESRDDLQTTLAFVDSLGLPAYRHNLLQLFPGTPAYRERARYGLDAGRDPATGVWRTRHAYEARAVRHLRNSTWHLERSARAHLLANALCGNPRPGVAGTRGAWAVVFHGDSAETSSSAWLREVLAVHGVVVVLARGGDAARSRTRWASALFKEDVPYGVLAILTAKRSPDSRSVLTLHGAGGLHFEIHGDWNSVSASRFVAEEAVLNIPIWLASAKAAIPPRSAAHRSGGVGRQIADGCRWWSRGRRCRSPQVLHAFANGAVRPCWSGPVIGRRGDSYANLAARAASLSGRRSGDPGRERCPLGPASEEAPDVGAAIRELELDARLGWMMRLGAPRLRREESHG